MTSQLADFAANQPKRTPAATEPQTPPFLETRDERIARLETENARLTALATQNGIRADEAEKGWHSVLAKYGQPEQRQTHEVLVSLANLAEETLAVQRHILSTLKTNAESRNVVEIDSNGSAGKIKVRVRCTGETLADAHADALEQFARAMAEVEAGSSDWAGTMAALQAKKGAA